MVGLGRVYRDAMRQMAAMTNLEVWYSRVEIEGMVALLQQQAAVTGSKVQAHIASTATRLTEKAHAKDSMKALDKLTTVVDGKRRIISDPPLIVPVEELFPEVESEEMVDLFHGVIRQYRQSLPTDRKHLLEGYQFSQMARKVVGVGSVGTRAWIILLHGPRHEDLPAVAAPKSEAAGREVFLYVISGAKERNPM